MPTEFNPAEVLALPLMANLATSSTDGPRNSPVWFVWEENALWMPGTTTNSTVQRLQADPRCAVEIVHFDNSQGVLLHVGLRGRASIESNSPEHFRRLLKKYLGPDQADWNSWFVDNIACIESPQTRWIKLVPDSVFTNNVSYFRTGPELAWPII